MNANIDQHLLQLDVSLGGGIVSDGIRVDTIDNPMLVIGLGGTGIDAMLRLKYMVNRRFNLPVNELTNRKEEKPKNIEFIAFETNQEDKLKTYPPEKGIGLDFQRELVLLSNPGIGALLNNPSLMDDCIKEWLNPEIEKGNGTNGAGGNRQLGRLLMFLKAKEVVESLTKKIKTLKKGTNQRLIVFVLSGVSGGTGSGCFLDIPYMIRGIMNREYGTDADDMVEIMGYLFTPDVNTTKSGLGLNDYSNIEKNGYAALKELDYWMNIDERGEMFTQRYMNMLEVKSYLPPYDLCHLISATNKNGVPLPNGYDYALNVAAENIVNFMATEKKNAGVDFAIQDYLSNVKTLVGNMQRPYHANYKYSILGASSAVLPIEEITTYLAYKLFDRMSKMFKSEPTQKEVEEFIRNLRMDSNSVMERFEMNIRQPLPDFQQSARFSYDNVIKTQSINLDSMLQDYVYAAEEEYIKIASQYPEELFKEFKRQVNNMFLEPNKGPFYASRLIHSSGFNILATIDSIINSLRSQLQKLPYDIEQRKYIAQDKLIEARKAMLIGKDKKKNDYIAAKIDEYYLRALDIKLRKMIDFYTELSHLINSENNKIYNVFTEVLNRLNDIFHKNSNILLKSDEIDNNGSRTYYWNVISVPDVAKNIDKMVDGSNSEELIRNFTNDLLEKAKSWTDEEEINVVSNISNFLTDKFGAAISRSMEEFLKVKYGEDKPIDKLVQDDIAARLKENAVPLFDYDKTVARNLIPPRWSMVSVPSNSPAIHKGIEQFQETASLDSNFNIKQSKVTNRIFWLYTENGVPLYAYAQLKKYEKAYEDTIFSSQGVGRHLVQNGANNWAHLPSPIPEKAWGETHVNDRVRKYNKEGRELFNKALERGCISVKDDGVKTSNNYICVITEEFDVDAFIKTYEMNLEGTINFNELEECISELTRLSKGGLKKVDAKNIFGSHDEEAARENFLRYPKLVNLIKEELKKYDTIEAKIAQLKAVIDKVQGQIQVFEDFFEAMFTNTIVKRGFLYIYDKDEEEKDEVPSFINLMKVNKYVEYEIFGSYKNLSEKHKTMVKKKSSRKFDKMLIDVEALTSKMNEMLLSYGKNLEVLEEKKDELLNGKEMYGFYKQVVDKLTAMKKNLEE